jgi:hypothetical protein
MLFLFFITFLIFRSEKTPLLAGVLLISIFFDFWSLRPVGQSGILILLFYLILYFFFWRLRQDNHRLKI